MSETRIVVPEGMLNTATGATRDITTGQFCVLRDGLEAALGWLCGELNSLERQPYDDAMAHQYNTCLADVRRIFLAPLDPEVPELVDVVEEFDRRRAR